MGLEPFRRLLNDTRFAHAAFIAETPVDAPGDEERNVKVLKSMVQSANDPCAVTICQMSIMNDQAVVFHRQLSRKSSDPKTPQAATDDATWIPIGSPSNRLGLSGGGWVPSFSVNGLLATIFQ